MVVAVTTGCIAVHDTSSVYCRWFTAAAAVNVIICHLHHHNELSVETRPVCLSHVVAHSPVVSPLFVLFVVLVASLMLRVSVYKRFLLIIP